MTFSKAFPRRKKDSSYPQWEEVFLSETEEKDIEEKAKTQNRELLKECVRDAQKIMQDENLKNYQTDLIHVAIALFEKRASHEIYWKENKAKEKFDKGE